MSENEIEVSKEVCILNVIRGTYLLLITIFTIDNEKFLLVAIFGTNDAVTC